MFSYQVFDGKFTQREVCQSPSKFFHKVFDAGLHDQRTLLKKTLKCKQTCRRYFKIFPLGPTVVTISDHYKTRGSVDWACVAHLSFCFEET